MQSKLQEIASLVGPENLFTDNASLIAWEQAANFNGNEPVLPLAIARPVTEGQAVALLKVCTNSSIPLAIRGHGIIPWSNNTARVANTLLLVTTGLSRIYDIDITNRIAYLQSGVSLESLQAACNKERLFLPVNELKGTIGGSIAMNQSYSAKYGPVGNYVESLRILATNGAEINCANQIGRLAAGFPLSPLFCGSMGCLGLIIECKLRLLPLPETRQQLIIAFKNEIDVLRSALQIQVKTFPAKMYFYDSAASAILAPSVPPAFLLAITFDGYPAEVKQMTLCAEKICATNNGRPGPAIAPEHKLLANLRPFLLQSLACPVSRLPELLAGVRDLLSSFQFEGAIFGPIAAGSLKLALPASKCVPKMAQFQQKLFLLQRLLNEDFPNEHEANLTHPQWAQSQQITFISEQLRAIFDPAGLLKAQPLPGTRENGF